MSVIIDGTSGITSPNLDLTSGQLSVADGGTGTAMGENLWRNRIINGAMNVWQRGTSFSPTASVAYGFADRFAAVSVSSNFTVTQSTDVPTGQGFKYSIKNQRTAASALTGVAYNYQVVESTNMIDLAGQSVTLSFWAKAGANFSSPNPSVIIATGTAADQGVGGMSAGSWTGYSAAISTNVTLTTSWTKYTITGTLASGILELGVSFGVAPAGTAGADDSFYITGVQLEKGSTATSFEYRPYGTELALCQRYYQRINSVNGTERFSAGYAANTTTAQVVVNFLNTFRTSPTAIEQDGTATHYAVTSNAGITVANAVPVFTAANTTSATVNIGVASITAGASLLGIFNNSAAYLGWSAEL